MPVALGRSAEAGQIVFADGAAVWRYDGMSGRLTILGSRTAWRGTDYFYVLGAQLFDSRTGTVRATVPTDMRAVAVSPDGRRLAYLVEDGQLIIVENGEPRRVLAERRFAALHWSPRSDSLALEVLTPASALPGGQVPKQLLVLDISSAQGIVVYDASAGPDASFRFATWSPSGRYVGIWEQKTTSGSIDQDGRPLVLVDVETRQRTLLGTTLMIRSWLDWTAPHTLTFVLGGSRAALENKSVRTWSPSAGQQQISNAGDISFSPSWSQDGQALYFVRAPSSVYQPDEFSRGQGSGDRHLVRRWVDRSGEEPILRSAAFAEEAVRASKSAPLLLVLRRRLGQADAGLELWLAGADGRPEQALVRLTTQGHAFDRLHTVFDDLVWGQ